MSQGLLRGSVWGSGQGGCVSALLVGVWPLRGREALWVCAGPPGVLFSPPVTVGPCVLAHEHVV